jgi:hypothetical protein
LVDVLSPGVGPPSADISSPDGTFLWVGVLVNVGLPKSEQLSLFVLSSFVICLLTVD